METAGTGLSKTSVSTRNKAVLAWVEAMSALCGPDEVYWCDGSERERVFLTQKAVERGEVEQLDQKKLPGCLYAHSKEDDVARVEKLTYICTRAKKDAGPTNNWMSPDEAMRTVWPLFAGAMKGRTMYVVPYLMGPAGSAMRRVGLMDKYS